ncbi:MAG: acetate/propionate family kinase [Proteobacteria bacterium]|nr:acetate/propionate family kinase [Pseudomonadota bacterium]
MHVLVVNCGSTSLKAAIVDVKTGQAAARAKVQRIGEAVPDHGAALAQALPSLMSEAGDVTIGAVGHRVVHGADKFEEPVVLDDAVEGFIEELTPLAPLHNPANLAGIRAARRLLPDVPHIAVFDTAFHSTLPNRAKRYAIPQELADKHGIRRYGFHGPSHKYVAERAADHLGTDIRELRIITCHLGGGCSIAAIEYGRSVETSMGLTPLEGLVMGTRSGDVDPGALLWLARQEGLDLDGLDELLNRKSGLAGLSGVGADMRDIEERAGDGDERCRAAVHAFCHRLRKYIGAYAAVLGGVDAIVFTAGIGQNSALVRHRVAARLDFLGARLSEDLNRDCKVSLENPVADISTRNSRCKLLVVATDEQHAIAEAAARVAQGLSELPEAPPIPISISARHVHLTQEHVEALYGPGAQLEPRVELTQPGQFAAQQRVTLIGPKRQIERVTVVGPTRGKTQVEISRTDEFHLGLDAPIRCSGDIANTPGLTLEGPHGRVTLAEGVIQSQRHIHMTPEDAEIYGVSDRDIVEVGVDTDGRNMVFGDVIVRVKASYHLDMHLDTDEGNAANLGRGSTGVLAETVGAVRVLRRSSTHDRVE